MNKSKKWMLLLLVSCFFFLCSCKYPEGVDYTKIPDKPDVTPTTSIIKSVVDLFNSSYDKLNKSTKNILQHISSIEQKTPADVKSNIQNDIDGIKNETASIDEVKNDLKISQGRLNDANKQLSVQQSKIDQWTKFAQNAQQENKKLEEENNRLKSESTARLNTILSVIGGICTAGIGACVFIIFLTRNKIAVYVAISCSVTLAICIAVTFYIKAIATMTLYIATPIVIGSIIYIVYISFKSKKAEEELVHTNEIVKQNLSLESRREIFGYGAEVGKVDLIQSPSTKKIVKQIRSRDNSTSKVKLAPSLPEFWTSKEDQISEKIISPKMATYKSVPLNKSGDYIEKFDDETII